MRANELRTAEDSGANGLGHRSRRVDELGAGAALGAAADSRQRAKIETWQRLRVAPLRRASARASLFCVFLLSACAGRPGGFAPSPEQSATDSSAQQAAPATEQEAAGNTESVSRALDDDALSGLEHALQQSRQRLAKATAMRSSATGSGAGEKSATGVDRGDAVGTATTSSMRKKAEAQSGESKRLYKNKTPSSASAKPAMSSPAGGAASTSAPANGATGTRDTGRGGQVDANRDSDKLGEEDVRQGPSPSSGTSAGGRNAPLGQGEGASFAENEQAARARLEQLLEEIDAEMMAGTPPRCEQICTVSSAICELGARVCDLAQSHEGEARYADACLRADQDCNDAHVACQNCED